MTISNEFSGFTQLLVEKIGLPQPVFIALTIGITLGWVCWRTRSTHVVINRIWRVIYGKNALADQEIGQFVENRSHLVTFRFFSGIPVRTLAQAKRLIHWSANHDEEIGDIKACGDLFDTEACQLREERIPGRPMLVFQLVLLATLAGSLVLSGYGLLTEQAFLQFKESKKWFWLSDTTAVSFSGDTVISKNMCMTGAEALNSTAFSENEVNVICKALEDTETRGLVERTVKQQRSLLVPIGLTITYWAWQCWLSLRRSYFARNMQRRINARTNHHNTRADTQEATNTEY